MPNAVWQLAHCVDCTVQHVLVNEREWETFCQRSCKIHTTWMFWTSLESNIWSCHLFGNSGAWTETQQVEFNVIHSIVFSKFVTWDGQSGLMIDDIFWVHISFSESAAVLPSARLARQSKYCSASLSSSTSTAKSCKMCCWKSFVITICVQESFSLARLCYSWGMISDVKDLNGVAIFSATIRLCKHGRFCLVAGFSFDLFQIIGNS